MKITLLIDRDLPKYGGLYKRNAELEVSKADGEAFIARGIAKKTKPTRAAADEIEGKA